MNQSNFFKPKNSRFYRQYKKENGNNNINNNNNFSNPNNENEINSLYSTILGKKEKNLKKIICVYQKNNTQNKFIGVCYIIPQENENVTKIYTGDYSIYQLDTFELFLSNLRPDLILLHCPNESRLKEIFTHFEDKVRFIQYINVQYNEVSEILKLYFEKLDQENFSKNLENNKVKINAKVSEIISDLSDCSLVAFYSILSLVLKHINSFENSNYYSEDNFTIRLQFEKIIFQEILFVSKKTQKEIKIFEEKIHPSLVKGKGKSKEGISVFNIFNKCITNQGRKLMRNIFQFPLKNINKINQRLECINDFFNFKNYSYIKYIISELRNIRDLEKNLSELKKFMINFKIWNGLFYSFESIIKILEIFKNEIFTENSTHFKLLLNIYSRIEKENIIKVYDFLLSCLDYMKDEIKPKIKLGINEDLDMLRNEYNLLDEVLSKYAIEYSNKIPKNSFMEKFMYVFLPQLGYMLAVEKSNGYNKFMKKVYKLVEKEEEIEEQIIEGVKINLKRKINEEDKNVNNNLNNIEQFNNESILTLNNDDFYQNKNNINNINNEIIIEEDPNENEEEEIINNNQDDLINKEELIIDDDNLMELQNYEETYILQKIKFTD